MVLGMWISCYFWNLYDFLAEAIPLTWRPISNAGAILRFKAQILPVDVLVRKDPVADDFNSQLISVTKSRFLTVCRNMEVENRVKWLVAKPKRKMVVVQVQDNSCM
jgi:hypothetical protein